MKVKVPDWLLFTIVLLFLVLPWLPFPRFYSILFRVLRLTSQTQQTCFTDSELETGILTGKLETTPLTEEEKRAFIPPCEKDDH